MSVLVLENKFVYTESFSFKILHTSIRVCLNEIEFPIHDPVNK